MNLVKNTALITGGTKGIGLELAKQLSAMGNKVIVTGRSTKNIQNVKNKFPAITIMQSDVTSEKDRRILFKEVSTQFPDLNILINNAGIGKSLNLKEEKLSQELNQEILTNLEAPIQMINTFLPLLRKQKKSAVINISSALAFIPFPVVPIYSATKAALHSYTLSLREQLNTESVRVIEVLPPTTQTEMLTGFSKDDLKKVPAMSTSDLVTYSLKQIEKGTTEVRPGPSNKLRIMSRLAPTYMLKVMSRSLKTA